MTFFCFVSFINQAQLFGAGSNPEEAQEKYPLGKIASRELKMLQLCENYLDSWPNNAEVMGDLFIIPTY
ncbi:MAG: hypothetical protein ACKO9Z_01180, partial [Planctomycetota bacterium]